MKVALFMQASELEEELKAYPHVAEIDRLKRSEHLPVLQWPTLPGLSLSLLAAIVSELAVEEIRSLNEQVAEEKELRVRAEQEAQEVSPVLVLPAWTQLAALQAQVELKALTSHNADKEKQEEADEQLRDALAQLESVRHALDFERKERASMEEELKTQLLQLQQSSLAEENNSEHASPLSPLPSPLSPLPCLSFLFL